MYPDTYRKARDGTIVIGGVPISSLAKKFGTPLYVLDYETLVARIHQYQKAVQAFQPPGMVYYAGKAFLCQAMAELLEGEEMGLDVVSGGELYTAIEAGFNPQKILFHGNVKTREEMTYALKVRVGQFVVDSLDELTLLNEVAGERGIKAPVLLRLTPGIDAHTHDFIRTGQFDSKFGFGLGDGIADTAVMQSLQLPHVHLNGFHAHIGSQILDGAPFVANAEALLRYSALWYERASYWPRVLDIGGGFGVRYQNGDTPPDVTSVLREIASLVRQWTPLGKTPPHIALEPGRSIIAEAGVTIYTVQALKTVVGGKHYIAVDGGMGDNIRPALYQAAYHAELDNKADSLSTSLVTVAGRYCESGDVLIPEAQLPVPQVGDNLVVYGTGAYNYSMASTYNRVPRPPVVLVRNGDTAIWVERENWADLTRLDRSFVSVKGVQA